MKYDYVLILYIFTIIISLYGFVLFSWWWAHQRKASSVFVYLTILFLGSVIENTVESYARYLGLNFPHSVMEDFQMSSLWPMRLVVLCAALSLIVAHMTYRAFFKKHDPHELPVGECVVEPIKSIKVPLIKINGEVIAVDIDVRKVAVDKLDKSLIDEKIIIVTTNNKKTD